MVFCIPESTLHTLPRLGMKLNYKNNSAGICITAITDGGDICHGFFGGVQEKQRIWLPTILTILFLGQ